MKNPTMPELEAGRIELRDVDIGDNEAVQTAVAQSDVVVNCAVVRERRGLAFRVNVLGTYYAIRAAVAAGHRRFINTGPSGTVVGPSYRAFTGINEQVPPWPGTGLYYITKGLGHAITRVFSQNYALHVLTCLFGGVSTAPEPKVQGQGTGGWATTLRDCGQAIARALHVSSSALASQHETFFISPPSPDGWLALGKATLVLGWEPQDRLRNYFIRPKL
jgi:nucleoside-diphosphate-sugar epimerase